MPALPAEPLNALIIADLHIDPAYDTRCARKLGRSVANEPFGSAGCDSPYALLDLTLAAAQRVMPSPDMLIVLGDLVVHGGPPDSSAIFANVSQRLHATFPNLPVGGCALALGNNDVRPDYAVNISDPTFYARQAYWTTKLCDLAPDESALLTSHGYYNRSLVNRTGPSLVVLNTDVYSPMENSNLSVEAYPDPFGQFAWLDALLADAQASNSSALIVGHIPPTIDSFYRSPMWQPYYASRYWELLHKRADAVAGQLYGHFHTEQFRVWPHVWTSATSSAQAPPATSAAVAAAPPLWALSSVSPIFHNNPSFHVLTLGGRTDGGGVDDGGGVGYSSGVGDGDGVGTSGSVGDGGGGGYSGGGGGDVGGSEKALMRPTELVTWYADLQAWNRETSTAKDESGGVDESLDGGAHGGAHHDGSRPPPRFVPLYNSTQLLSLADIGANRRDAGPSLLTNANYAQLAVRFRQPEGDAAFEAFHAFVEVGHQPVVERTCTLPTDIAHHCTVCVDGCRLAWACLLLEGAAGDAAYNACMAEAMDRGPGTVATGLGVTAGLLVVAATVFGLMCACRQHRLEKQQEEKEAKGMAEGMRAPIHGVHTLMHAQSRSYGNLEGNLNLKPACDAPTPGGGSLPPPPLTSAISRQEATAGSAAPNSVPKTPYETLDEGL